LTQVEKNIKGGTKVYFFPGLDGIKGGKPGYERYKWSQFAILINKNLLNYLKSKQQKIE
jgi:hypothetical protein